LFEKIAVAIITPTHTKNSFTTGLEIAKKFNSELTVMECLYKIQPRFYFFETESDKQVTRDQMEKLENELEEWKKIAEKENIKIKTELALTESISHTVIEYVKEQKISLLIVDYPKLSKVEATHYDEIINAIHHEAPCNLLTMQPT